ncbi:beta-eliminating lyase [Stachybotrys elegans]|uniref:Beta-eliminating lyase n=1 Tax=Stachybotrys elegans TaxID=80388 RepID=A0A8K0SN00_9HYPO|nr:beta-eliminating lyase [Stachybotrys elegans]
MSPFHENPLLHPPTHQSMVVRSLQSVTAEDREAILQDVEYNIFNFPAGLLTVDFLTDSGTSAMTDVQWAALMRGDESYGRNWGYYCLLDAFRDIFDPKDSQNRLYENIVMGNVSVKFYRDKVLEQHEGGFANGGVNQLERPNFFIVPQGRCAESLLFSSVAAHPVQGSQKPIIISNGFFDTTAANASLSGFELQAFTQPGLSDPFPAELIGKKNPFKGNLDIAATSDFVNKHEVTMILITVTNNWAAGQPVSMANIRETAAIAKKNNIPLFFDACRFAENAFFIHKYEDGYSDKTILEIIHEMFSCVDGFTISLKKDALANMGGVLCFKDGSLFAKRYEGIGLDIKARQIVNYGNDAYGGMSGRDLMAATVGLYENTKLSFLEQRIGQVQSFAQKLQANGIAVLSPPGGHAVYLDMDDFYHGCNRKPDDFASVGFAIELLKAFGIRSIESGPFAWNADKKTPEEQAKIPNLVRFAIPRHVFSDAHIDYTVACIKELHKRRHEIPNVVITRGRDMQLRHFGAGMKPVLPSQPRRTYHEEANRQLELLFHAVGEEAGLKQKQTDALELAMSAWGDELIPEKLDEFSWHSNVSNDHSPYELSLAIDPHTGDHELRFLVEAQARENSRAKYQESAIQLNEALLKKYGDTMSFEQFELIRDIFMPLEVSMWHSFASSKSAQKWRLYLGPMPADKHQSSAMTRDALKLLGYDDAWKVTESIMSPDDFIVYICLGCSSSVNDGEIKVYIAHRDATSSTLAEKQLRLCPEASAYEIQNFLVTMSGNSHGPYSNKPVVTTLYFKKKDPKNLTTAIHFPIDANVANDAEAKERIERYMENISAPAVYREKYRKTLATMQRRPLASGRGIHSWVSFKQKPGGGVINTFYFSPELYGPLA